MSSLPVVLLAIFGSSLVLTQHVYNYRTLTWNMQGAGGSGRPDQKWNHLKTNVLLPEFSAGKNKKQPFEVVALQESGQPPESARTPVYHHVNYANVCHEMVTYVPLNAVVDFEKHRKENTSADPTLTVIDRGNNGYKHCTTGYTNVKEYRWSLGPSSRSPVAYYVYHYALTQKQDITKERATLRTNIAIVSLHRADEVFIFTEDEAKANRPVLGIRNGTRFFFSLHAPSGTAKENTSAAKLVRHIEIYLANYQKKEQKSQVSWLIMGDFNKDPTVLQGQLDSQELKPASDTPKYSWKIINTGKSTQKNSGELDYAVLGFAPRNTLTDEMSAHHNQALKKERDSDHDGINFEPKK